jgi:ATP-dependent exoDNAse (exonuclease V) beta subunit
VAATRARHGLHLLGRVEPDGKGGWKTPHYRSFLRRLWPALREQFGEAASGLGLSPPAERSAEEASPTADASAPSPVTTLRRLPGDWSPPPRPAPLRLRRGPEIVPGDEEDPALAPPPLEFLWARPTTRLVGIVVHRSLQRMAQLGEAAQTAAWIERRRSHHVAALRRLGIGPDRLDEALVRVETALRRTLEDERGRWVLAPHADGECELAITSWEEGRPVEVILDRTFVAEGVRWIVDYKTGGHEGRDVEAFLDEEQARYRAQLERYARIVARLKGEPADQPIRLGLYFPLLQGWREWEAPGR